MGQSGAIAKRDHAQVAPCAFEQMRKRLLHFGLNKIRRSVNGTQSGRIAGFPGGIAEKKVEDTVACDTVKCVS